MGSTTRAVVPSASNHSTPVGCAKIVYNETVPGCNLTYHSLLLFNLGIKPGIGKQPSLKKLLRCQLCIVESNNQSLDFLRQRSNIVQSSVRKPIILQNLTDLTLPSNAKENRTRNISIILSGIRDESSIQLKPHGFTRDQSFYPKNYVPMDLSKYRNRNTTSVPRTKRSLLTKVEDFGRTHHSSSSQAPTCVVQLHCWKQLLVNALIVIGMIYFQELMQRHQF